MVNKVTLDRTNTTPKKNKTLTSVRIVRVKNRPFYISTN